MSVCVVQNGEKAQSPGEFECPPGWSWEDEWTFDINRAVDEKGNVNVQLKYAPFVAFFFNNVSLTRSGSMPMRVF